MRGHVSSCFQFIIVIAIVGIVVQVSVSTIINYKSCHIIYTHNINIYIYLFRGRDSFEEHLLSDMFEFQTRASIQPQHKAEGRVKEGSSPQCSGSLANPKGWMMQLSRIKHQILLGVPRFQRKDIGKTQRWVVDYIQNDLVRLSEIQ